MGNILTGDSATFTELKWDTEFFGVTSAQAVLHKPLTLSDWNKLKKKFTDYEFISIVNKKSEPINSQLIGKDTNAFIADINIQFEKKIVKPQGIVEGILICNSLMRDEQILTIADFQFSKFTEDPELSKRGGNLVYKHWLKNAFEQENKFFVLSKDETGNINGFLLFSYIGSTCVIELIAVSKKNAEKGIGTRLFTALEYDAYQKGIFNIKVGTQIRNLGAINFYNKVGCKQVECHQVYHLWNLK